MRRRATALTVWLAASSVLGILAYSAAHEAGHAVVALANGARIERFVIGVDAHVAWSGGSFSAGATTLSHVAGAALPAVLLLLALIAYRRTVRSDAYHTLYAVAAACTVGSLLAWVAIPVVATVGSPPPDDDVTLFLDSSGMAPPALAALAAGSIAVLVAVAVGRRLPQTLFGILREVAAEEKGQTSTSSRPGT